MPKCFAEGDETTLFLLQIRSSDFWLAIFIENYSS